MPKITRDEVAYMAGLARINVDDAALDRLAPELDAILVSMAAIQDAAGDDVPPMSHPLALTNVFRDDILTPCLSAEEALSGAPDVEQQRFKVPRILEDL